MNTNNLYVLLINQHVVCQADSDEQVFKVYSRVNKTVRYTSKLYVDIIKNDVYYIANEVKYINDSIYDDQFADDYKMYGYSRYGKLTSFIVHIDRDIMVPCKVINFIHPISKDVYTLITSTIIENNYTKY